MPEPKVIEGSHNAGGGRFAIVASRFNDFLVQPLVEGALHAIETHGGDSGKVTLVWVPGAFEIPLVAKKLAQSGKHDAIICLGAVVRGDTPHFEYVAGQAARGISEAGLQTLVPCIFGVVTTDNLDQAIARCGEKESNKGFEAAVAAIEMVNVIKELNHEGKSPRGKDAR